jgi:hypothetical protein
VTDSITSCWEGEKGDQTTGRDSERERRIPKEYIVIFFQELFELVFIVLQDEISVISVEIRVVNWTKG